MDQLASEKPQSPGKVDKTNLTVDGNLSFTETQYKGDDTITQQFKTSGSLLDTALAKKLEIRKSTFIDY